MLSRKNIVVVFLIGGALIASTIYYTQYSTNRVYQENVPLLQLGDNVKNHTTQAHLWLEELLAGDVGVNYETDILSLFAKAEESIRAGIVTTSKNNTLSTITPLLKKSVDDLVLLKEAASERVNKKQTFVATVSDSLSVAGSDSYAGDDMDKAFDVAYDRLQKDLDEVVTELEIVTKKRSILYNRLSQISTALLAIFIGVGCFVLYKILGQNEQNTENAILQFKDEQQRTKLLSDFLENISSGNYEVNIVDEKNLELTQKLNLIRDQLKEDDMKEKHRTWSTTGLAQIGDILRASNSSTTELYDSIIRFVVKYTESNQGGLFIFNEENEQHNYLELAACYAFERKKFLQKRVDIGEGLVGQCFIEGERIYLLDVPTEYITITSGLGGSNPSSLLLVPMKVNEKIYGVIELASFRKFERFEVELVEKLAESIASTISTVRTNESTRVLLEKTQQQTEEMRAQEEEMRQNMEELEATQEEMRRKEKHLQNLLETEKSNNRMSA
jgi:GAF domain